jgi:type I restriction enzyme S subunit
MSKYPTYKLGEICELLNGYAFKSSKYIQSGLRVIRITNVKKGYVIDEDPQFYPIETQEELKKYILKKDDLLVSLTGNVGRVGILNEKLLPAALNQRVGCLRIKDKSVVSLQYLYYLLNTNSFEKDCINSSRGIAQKNMSTEWLKDYEVSIPPLPIQHQIVSRIESLFAELDKAVEHLRTAQQQLKTYRQAVLNYWLNNEDGKWETVKIESVANVVSGYAFKSNLFKDSGKYQIIRIGNIRPGIIRINESPVYYGEIPSGTCSKVLLKKKDVVITLTGTRKKRDYGYTAMVTQENLLLNQRLAYFRFDNKQYEPAFFLYYSWTDSFKDDFFSYETGNVGQGNVGIKAITKTEIPVPPLSEQQRIVKEIESRLSQAEATEARIAEALQKTEALRQSILKKAFSGELV